MAPLADDPGFTLVGPGEWGPWIDGGAWLTCGGVKVDLLYRELGRVRAAVAQASWTGRWSGCGASPWSCGRCYRGLTRSEPDGG